MQDLSFDGYNLRHLVKKNVLLGKNGCGKSHLLKLVEQHLISLPDHGAIRYLSPERAGTLEYEAGVDQQVSGNIDFLSNSRRRNQAAQFRQQSTVQYRRLESAVLREIESDHVKRKDLNYTFDLTIDRINALLDRVRLSRGQPNFTVTDRLTGAPVSTTEVSSGEAELISLAIECLVYARDCQSGKLNVLMIDEPDVHLHPDLQARFARFLEKLCDEGEFLLLMATHSTAFLGAMREDGDTALCFMKYGDKELTFSPITDTYRKVLPVFGAHPLSNIFNESPILLVEGEDDERVWQQVVRSARGRVKLFPVAVEGEGELSAFEGDVVRILESVYDQAVGYSLRDRDDDPLEIGDRGPLRRMRLTCREVENLLLADETLALTGHDWESLRARIEVWLAANPTHGHHAAMVAFSESGFDRLDGKLKDIRNDLMGLLDSNKPWEILVGQAINSLAAFEPSGDGMGLAEFLGERVCKELLRLLPPEAA